MKSGLKHPNFIVTKDDNTIYAVDSLDYYIKSVDLISKHLDSIKMDFLPRTMYCSPDGKWLYVGGHREKNGIVSVIDISSKKVKKSIPISFDVVSMAISTDGKRLYVSSSAKSKGLTVIDLKSEKVDKEIKNFDFSGSIAISRDNQRLYFYGSNNKEIQVSNVSNFSLLKTIASDASYLSFTNDGKSIFALNEKKINKITYDINELLYDYNLESRPYGVVTTSDGHGFVWLPKEQYIFEFPVTDSTRSQDAGTDLELKFKRFREVLKNDKSIDAQRLSLQKQKDSCDRKLGLTNAIHQLVIPVIKKILTDLDNPNFEFFETSPSYLNCSASISDFHDGIRSKINSKYAITPNFRFRFSKEQIVMTIFDDGIDKEPVTLIMPMNSFKVNTPTVNYQQDSATTTIEESTESQIKKFVKEYFYGKIEELNHEHQRQY